MIIKDNNNLRRALVDLSNIHDATTMWLINGMIGYLKTPKDWLNAKNIIVRAFEFSGGELRGDSPFMDRRVRYGLCSMTQKLFPPDTKITYPCYSWQDLTDEDCGEIYKTLNLIICKYFLDYIMDNSDTLDEYGDFGKKQQIEVVKALKKEMKRIEGVEVKSRTDYFCSGYIPRDNE